MNNETRTRLAATIRRYCAEHPEQRLCFAMDCLDRASCLILDGLRLNDALAGCFQGALLTALYRTEVAA